MVVIHWKKIKPLTLNTFFYAKTTKLYQTILQNQYILLYSSLTTAMVYYKVVYVSSLFA